MFPNGAKNAPTACTPGFAINNTVFHYPPTNQILDPISLPPWESTSTFPMGQQIRKQLVHQDLPLITQCSAPPPTKCWIQVLCPVGRVLVLSQWAKNTQTACPPGFAPNNTAFHYPPAQILDPSSCADAPRGLLLWLRRTERQVASPAYGMGATPGPLRRTGPPGSECRGQYGTATRAAGVCRSETRGPRAHEADTKGCLKPLSRPLQAVVTLADTPRPSRPEVGYDPWVGEAVQPPRLQSVAAALRPKPATVPYAQACSVWESQGPESESGPATGHPSAAALPTLADKKAANDPFSPALKKQLRGVSAMRRALPSRMER